MRHPAAVGTHEAQQDLDAGRFARAGGAGQHQGLAGGDAERQPVQRRAARRVPGQPHILERHGDALGGDGAHLAAGAGGGAGGRSISDSAAPVACSRSW